MKLNIEELVNDTIKELEKEVNGGDLGATRGGDLDAGSANFGASRGDLRADLSGAGAVGASAGSANFGTGAASIVGANAAGASKISLDKNASSANTSASSANTSASSANTSTASAKDDSEFSYQLEQIKSPEDAIVVLKDEHKTSEEIFLKDLKERILVLFEGLSVQDSKQEQRLAITIEFLEFLLASIEDRLG